MNSKTDYDKASVRWEAGRVARWHAHPTIHPQTVADHTYGVLQWLAYLVPRADLTKRLMLATLNHDVAELFTGDIPFTAKRAYPQFKTVLNEVEDDLHERLDVVFALTAKEESLLKFADLAEMGHYALRERVLGNSTMDEVLDNVINALIKLVSEWDNEGDEGMVARMDIAIERLTEEVNHDGFEQ